jgi:hypothetical protein
MQDPVYHEQPNPQLPPILEYSLPVAFGELNHLGARSIPSWFQRFDSLDSTGVIEILKKDWEEISGPSARRIADALIQRIPRSIIVDTDDAWLRMDLACLDYNVVGLHAPKKDCELAQSASQNFPVPDFESIYKHFSNLGEGVISYENALWMSPEGVTEESTPGCGVWSGALPIYYICNGDLVLLSREGRIGRWLHEYCSRPVSAGFTDGSCVQPIAENFDSFITIYLDYLSSPQVDQKNYPLW